MFFLSRLSDRKKLISVKFNTWGIFSLKLCLFLLLTILRSSCLHTFLLSCWLCLFLYLDIKHLLVFIINDVNLVGIATFSFYIIDVFVKLTLFNHGSDPTAIFLIVLLVHDRSCGIRWRIRVGIRQKGLYRSQNTWNIIDRRPHVLQNIKTNRAISVDVWMEHCG